MKRFLLFILIGLFGLLSLSAVLAYDMSADGLHRLADLMPNDLQLFMAVEISPEMFKEVDTFIETIGDSMPLTYPREIRSQWRDFSAGQAFIELLLDYDIPMFDLYPAMGQYMGIGMSSDDMSFDVEDGEFWVVVDILDQEKMHKVLLDVSSISDGQLISSGDVITYELEGFGTLAITKTHLVITNATSDMFDIQPLSKHAEFISVLNILEEDRYDGVLYISKAFMDMLLEDAADEQLYFGSVTDGFGAVVMGFNLQGQTAVVDMGWIIDNPDFAPELNLDMLAELPASTDFIVATANFRMMYDSLVDFIRTSAEESGDDDPTPFLDVVLNYGKLDFEDDFLSWTTGTYAIFMGADLSDLDTMDSSNLDDFMFGVAFEATDPDKVVEFVDVLGDVLDDFANAADELTLKHITLDGKPALNIFINDSSLGSSLSQFVLVPTDTFLYFGTANGYEEIESGNTLGSMSDLDLALENALETPNAIIYLNSELSVFMTTLAVMGADEPSYDFLSEVQNRDFNRADSPTVASYYAALDWLEQVISNTTVTSWGSEDGKAQMRITLSLK